MSQLHVYHDKTFEGEIILLTHESGLLAPFYLSNVNIDFLLSRGDKGSLLHECNSYPFSSAFFISPSYFWGIHADILRFFPRTSHVPLVFFSSSVSVFPFVYIQEEV